MNERQNRNKAYGRHFLNGNWELFRPACGYVCVYESLRVSLHINVCECVYLYSNGIDRQTESIEMFTNTFKRSHSSILRIYIERETEPSCYVCTVHSLQHTVCKVYICGSTSSVWLFICQFYWWKIIDRILTTKSSSRNIAVAVVERMNEDRTTLAACLFPIVYNMKQRIVFGADVCLCVYVSLYTRVVVAVVVHGCAFSHMHVCFCVCERIHLNGIVSKTKQQHIFLTMTNKMKIIEQRMNRKYCKKRNKYTIKCTHSQDQIKWLKTMADDFSVKIEMFFLFLHNNRMKIMIEIILI